jgi:hypothetical protein
MRDARPFLGRVVAVLISLVPAAAATADEFTIAVLPDTQQETSGTRFTNRLTWIVNNRASKNIKFMLHSGDMMNFNLDSQYAFMSQGLKVLDNAAFPYATCIGNHDTAAVRSDSGSAAPGDVHANLRNTTKYNSYFPTTRYRALGGVYEAGKIDNAWHSFSAGGLNWLVVNLELWPRAGAVTWAKGVVANHPNHNVIILTHSFLTSSSTIEQSNGGYGDNSPQYVFDNLVKQYANVRFTFSGHVGSHGYRTDTGVNGNKIYSYLQCYHDNVTNPTRLITIDTAAGTIKSTVYCPYDNTTKNDGSTFTVSGVSWVPAGSATPAPAAPSNLKAAAASSTQINLTWTDNASNETGFKIERKTGSGGTWAQVATAGANATSWSNTGLSASTAYYYRVRATNAGGDSAYSAEASATTLVVAPAAPTNLNSSAASTSQINLAWTDNAGNETGFKIERKTGSGGTWAQVATTGSNATSWSNTGLAASTTYYFRIRATNAGGDSAYSNEASATTLTPAPAAPTGLSATAVSATQVNLSWADNAGNETGFKIERKTGSGGTWGQVATTGSNVTGWSNTGLTGSTTYYYRVRATNAGGDSAYSNEAGATTPAPPPPVGTGTGLRGEYFDNADFTAARLARTDTTVYFDWGSGSPDAQLAADAFAVRWSGAVQPRYSQTYTFYATTDDGVRLWVNGTLLIDAWADRSAAESSGTIALTALRKYDIRMDYYENGGGASAKLSWSCPGQAKEVIPRSQLYPWSSRDVGSVGVAGSDMGGTGSFAVDGSGADIWDAADGFRYVYQLVTGDGEIRARVAGVENTNAWAKAGVMIREDFTAGSRHAMMAVTPGSGLAFQRRKTAGGTSLHTSGGSAVAPCWVRVVRQGNNFSAYKSADGNAWTWVGTDSMVPGSPLWMGLAVTSHDNAVACTANFDNAATLTSAAPAGALVTVTNVSTVKPYSLATARVGAPAYIDRTYTITALPAAMDAGVLVRTANDDKAVTAGSHLTLRLGQSATVYVVYDKKGTVPAWLGGWTLRTDTVTTTDAGPSPMRVFQRSVGAGDLVLGGNLASPASGSLDNYFVVVQPAAAAKAIGDTFFEEGPIPPDRWQHDGDSDGDGLLDGFESGKGLDGAKPDTDGDGTMDEGVVGASGRTMWEEQEGAVLAAAPGEDGGDGRCGLVGLDLLAPLGLLWLVGRRRSRRL